MTRKETKELFWILAIALSALFVTIAVVMGLCWVACGYKAQALTELTGQPFTQSQVFWAGDAVEYQIELHKTDERTTK